MRILSWNINSIRTLPQYHPWNALKTGDAILDELGADIICFQEMKITRSSLPPTLALPSTYDSFFSFPTNNSGYSGVGTYTHSVRARPLKAEEGLTGSIHPPNLKPSWNPHQERISNVYPHAYDLEGELFADQEGNTPDDLSVLDREGRCLTLDFGLFVLINTYCPNETSDTRLPYKMNYHLLLQSRIEQLIKDGREVVVLGDLNICAQPLDHCDGHLESVREGFWEHPARKWARVLFGEGGIMVDVVRTFWPDRKGMYTCWNTRISARESNYGTRVDYILVTRGLLPWIKAGDIQPSVKGSDHCPIWVDLRDEIEVDVDVRGEGGEGGRGAKKTIMLRDVMRVGGTGGGKEREPPRLAAKYWEEYSGKQTLLSTFFGKGSGSGSRGGGEKIVPSSTASSSPVVGRDGGVTTGDTQAVVIDSELGAAIVDGLDVPGPSELPVLSLPRDQAQDLDRDSPQPPISPNPGPLSSSLPPIPLALAPAPTPRHPYSQIKQAPSLSQYPHEAVKKRKQPDEAPSSAKPNTKKKQKAGQTKLSTFFAQPSSSTSARGSKKETTDQDEDQVEADYRLALELSASQETLLFQALPVSSSSALAPNGKQTTSAWSHLLGPLKPPNCLVHNEPAKELTVTKTCPNKGKNFFICSRPVGPGYDRGRGERLREEVDHQWRCNYFKWASEVKREIMREKSGTQSNGT